MLAVHSAFPVSDMFLVACACATFLCAYGSTIGGLVPSIEYVMHSFLELAFMHFGKHT